MNVRRKETREGGECESGGKRKGGREGGSKAKGNAQAMGSGHGRALSALRAKCGSGRKLPEKVKERQGARDSANENVSGGGA
jgi:hypothetical protein